MIEILGIISSALIVLSLIFKTTTLKGTVRMRSINFIGSICFIIYSIFINSPSVFIANSATAVINICFIFKEVKDASKVKEVNDEVL